LFFFKQKTAYEVCTCLEFRRVLFRSSRATSQARHGDGNSVAAAGARGGNVGAADGVAPARATRRSARARMAAIGRHHRLGRDGLDRKSTRLNSSHVKISYAVFCLKQK